MKRDQWIQTYGKTVFAYGDIEATTGITPQAIAHALSRIPRFGGHSEEEWTVAHHTLLVRDIACLYAEEDLGKGTYPYILVNVWALLHDAHEAYIGDIPAPLKRHLRERYDFHVERIEEDIDRMIQKTFALPYIPPAVVKVVKKADKLALCIERKRFMQSNLTWLIDQELIPDNIKHFTPERRIISSTGIKLELENDIVEALEEYHAQR